MGMNSFSNKSAQSQRAQIEEELSGILSNYADGDEFTASAFQALKQIKFEPVDMSKLRKLWSKSDPDRRADPRFEIKMTVLVCNHRKAFRTQTENISISGLLLKDCLPIEFSKYTFDVIVIDEIDGKIKNYMLFRGKAVDGSLRSPGVLFESLEADAEEQLIKLFNRLSPIKAG